MPAPCLLAREPGVSFVEAARAQSLARGEELRLPVAPVAHLLDSAFKEEASNSASPVFRIDEHPRQMCKAGNATLAPLSFPGIRPKRAAIGSPPAPPTANQCRVQQLPSRHSGIRHLRLALVSALGAAPALWALRSAVGTSRRTRDPACTPAQRTAKRRRKRGGATPPPRRRSSRDDVR